MSHFMSKPSVIHHLYFCNLQIIKIPIVCNLYIGIILALKCAPLCFRDLQSATQGDSHHSTNFTP